MGTRPGRRPLLLGRPGRVGRGGELGLGEWKRLWSLEEEWAAARPGGRRCAAGRGVRGRRAGTPAGRAAAAALPRRRSRWPAGRGEGVSEGDSGGLAREEQTSSPFSPNHSGEEWRRLGSGGDCKDRNCVPSAFYIGFNVRSPRILFLGVRGI